MDSKKVDLRGIEPRISEEQHANSPRDCLHKLGALTIGLQVLCRKPVVDCLHYQMTSHISPTPLILCQPQAYTPYGVSALVIHWVCTSTRPLSPPIRLMHSDQWWMRLMDTRHCIVLESKVQHKVKIALSEWVTCVAWALPLTCGPPSRVPCYNIRAVWSLVWVLGVYCILVK